MNEELRLFNEKIARTWTVADERCATKLILAYHRFREAGLSEKDAVSMVRLWDASRAGSWFAGPDNNKHPIHKKLVQRHQAARTGRGES